MILWRGSWEGKIPTANRRLAARCRGGKAVMYPTPEYAAAKEHMSLSWRTSEGIEGPADILIEVQLWKMRDSDNAIKIVLDAMESAGVIENDRQIRDIAVRRDYHSRRAADRLDVILISPETETVGRCWDGIDE